MFFMEALEHVKEEIKKQKQVDLKNIQENYRNTMKEVWLFLTRYCDRKQ